MVEHLNTNKTEEQILFCSSVLWFFEYPELSSHLISGSIDWDLFTFPLVRPQILHQTNEF